MNSIKINFFTEEAKNIVEAALVHWVINHYRTWFADVDSIEFDDAFAPAGEICLSSSYHDLKQAKIDMIARAIKEMLQRAQRWEEYCDTEIIKPDGTKEYDLVNKTNLLDKTNDTCIYTKIFQKNEYGKRLWHEHKYVKINIKHAWIMYDLLLNHRQSTIEKKYGIEAIDAIVGKHRDPMEIEQAKIKSQEIEKTKTEIDAEIQKITYEYNSKIRAIQTERDAKVDELKKIEHEKIIKINQDFEQMKIMSANIG